MIIDAEEVYMYHKLLDTLPLDIQASYIPALISPTLYDFPITDGVPHGRDRSKRIVGAPAPKHGRRRALGDINGRRLPKTVSSNPKPALNRNGKRNLENQNPGLDGWVESALTIDEIPRKKFCSARGCGGLCGDRWQFGYGGGDHPEMVSICSMICWNCQGVGSPLTFHQLKELARLHSPSLFFLSETKNKVHRLDFIRRSLNMDSAIRVDPVGSSGGLALFWKGKSSVTLVKMCSWFNDVRIFYEVLNKSWRLVNVYFSPVDNERRKQWDFFVNYKSCLGDDWVIWGDMNDIMCSDEKLGGNIRPSWSGDDYIQERLDRVLATPSWCLLFNQSSVTHLETVGSDHNALLLNLRAISTKNRVPFLFDARWANDDEVREIIRQSWASSIQGSRSFSVFKKIQTCGAFLTNWKRRKWADSGKVIEELKSKVFRLRNSDKGPPPGTIQNLKWRLKLEWDKEKLFWKQKSRIIWLQHGDKNTRFFHASVMQRRSTNRISGIEMSNENQSAFIGGRQISDSVLIAHELMHSLKNRRYGKKGWVALKLDMAKAYDHIEWPYLEAVLRRFGFDEQWIRWVMACVTSVSFATVINGNKGDLFSPSRGIWQGCPLSPYLFILCAEGFHYLIQKEIADQTRRGIKVGLHCPPISHLFFADDSILFWEASDAGCHAIEDILRKYEGASGQRVNNEKSTLFFSPNTPSDVKQGISNFLNIRIETQRGKYLGLPSIIDKFKMEVFKYVSDRVLDRLKSWRDSTLNPAGKEVLIKSVASTMPNYVMQCFLLPKQVCRNLCCAIRKFWLGGGGGGAKESENKINWVRWNKLCERKSKGGLGFRDIHVLILRS
ncbi:hypothetical protein RHSIM_Rhsim02G0183800 [Rhododendron simsii]|uniref:Reverse transcriptase domain-containing protein n=1 Tax=Rhododendron simsii TaxID=118357 RepID=A0A834HFR2_RHOSS|nr:hypothetical protein RHSIM_Rhsim02G0183800 [Rhododendron simsii]